MLSEVKVRFMYKKTKEKAELFGILHIPPTVLSLNLEWRWTLVGNK